MSSIYDELLIATEHDVHAWCLPNLQGEGRKRWVGSRNGDKLAAWSARNDAEGYGQFFCVATIEHRAPRKKEYARELPFIFADVDCKDIDLPREEIEARLRSLELGPSRIHDTGNGFHCFWRLDTPALLQEDNTMDQVEALLKRLANHIGGDLQVAQVVALLRVPGTHNSKRGEWRPVRLIHEAPGTYTLEELDAWVGTAREPVMVRRNRQTNPFLRVAEEQSFRAPVDVEARLQAMEFEGEGENGVHATHLSVTASLCAAGMAEDEIVALVMGYTQNLAGTEAWDWRQEERTLRTMIRDFEVKLERQERSGQRSTARDISQALRPLIQEQEETQNDPPENVVSLSQARKDRKAKLERDDDDIPKLSKKKKNEHEVIGRGILAWLADNDQQIMYTEDQCWLYDKGIWKAWTERQEKDWMNRRVEEGCVELALVSSTRIVNETRAWLQRQPKLHKPKIKWDDFGRGCIAIRNGVLDVEDDSILPLEAEDYATRVMDVGYAPDARCPTWERMLKTDYQFDPDTISFLQEFFGTCLVTEKPRGLMRALVLLGPSNTGKSNILNVMAGLIAPVHNSTPLALLENSHGLMAFMQPNPWVLHEAFDQSRWEMSATAKALLSGDPVNVNIKNGPMLSITFRQPVLWGTNVPPQFKEASRAMENRLAIVKMHRAFNPLRMVGTALEADRAGYRNPAEMILDKERAGLLNWAIVGLKRALARGTFVFTEEMTRSLHAMRTDSNMAAGFVEACCTMDPDSYVWTSDFYGAFGTWWRDHRGGVVPSVDALGRAMSALSDPRILTGQRISHHRVYAGLKMNDDGLDCWNGYSASQRAAESGQRISQDAGIVNRTITAETLQNPEFRTMQDAHRTWNPDGDHS